MKHPSATLLISTYNRPDALDACLESVSQLSPLPDEIVIADDGSDAATKEVVSRWKNRIGTPLHHVWHEDRGFRLAAIRNKALAKSGGEYIIQIDGDEILHPRFIADHLRYARRGYFCKGCRVKLGPKVTEQICSERNDDDSVINRPHVRVWKLLLSDIEDGRVKGLRMRLPAWWFANFFKQRDYYALGGNMSYWRDDIVALNGYDEKFEGWGREDDDLAHRLGRWGLLKRDLRFTAICYHLWHPENSRALTDTNDAYIKKQDRLGTIRCEDGLDKYRQE